MKIVVAGDNHGEIDDLKQIVKREKNVDLFLHTGDSQLSDFQLSPFITVRGNCDLGPEFPEKRIISTPQGKLCLTHGHLLFKYNLAFLAGNDIKIFVTGHTHIHKAWKVDDILFINPGSISYPRDGAEGTYLVLLIGESGISYNFKSFYAENL